MILRLNLVLNGPFHIPNGAFKLEKLPFVSSFKIISKRYHGPTSRDMFCIEMCSLKKVFLKQCLCPQNSGLN
jgi:hypothetical protein